MHYRRPLTLVQAAFLEGEERREREMDRNGTVSAAAECESLVSNERLECDSPVMWPDQNFCKFLCCAAAARSQSIIYHVYSHTCSW